MKKQKDSGREKVSGRSGLLFFNEGGELSYRVGVEYILRSCFIQIVKAYVNLITESSIEFCKNFVHGSWWLLLVRRYKESVGIST